MGDDRWGGTDVDGTRIHSTHMIGAGQYGGLAQSLRGQRRRGEFVDSSLPSSSYSNWHKFRKRHYFLVVSSKQHSKFMYLSNNTGFIK